MPIQVVGREVQPHGRMAAEGVRELKAEARALDHEDIDRIVIHRGHERDVRVADLLGPQSGGSEKVRGDHGGGGLPVGAGDTENGPPSVRTRQLPFVGNVDLGTNGDACGNCCGDHRTVGRHPGCRDENVHPFEKRGD